MADKEINIDGVDVSECEYLQYKGCDFAQCLIKMASFDLKCEGYNCHYKQHKKKEQKLDKIKNMVTDDDGLVQDYQTAYDLAVDILQIIERGE